MPKSPKIALLVLSAVLVCGTAISGSLTMAGNGGGPVKGTGGVVPSGVFATEQEPATIQVLGGNPGGGVALEVTARPVGGDASSSPYLVSVFATEGKSGKDIPKLLGSFSFYPAHAGEAQTFVIPTSQIDDSPRTKNLTLSIKLTPANPARDIKDAAVEILGARVVK
jgi:hypothetical protein